METKVFIILCYYIILGAAVLTIFTIALINLNEKALLDYFTCEGKGVSPYNSNTSSSCTHQKNSIQATVNPIPSSVAIVILGFLPAVNLVYVVKFSDLKWKLKTYSQNRQVQYVQKEVNSATRYVTYNKHKNTTLQHGTLTVHTKTVNTEPLITSQMNNDLRR